MSTFPPAASEVLIATSRETPPRSIIVRMELSGYRLLKVALKGHAIVTNLPHWMNPAYVPNREIPRRLRSGGDASVAGSSDICMRAFSGSSCSGRKETSRPWMRRTFFSKSMQAWCAFSMSRPNRRSTSRPCIISSDMFFGFTYRMFRTSMIVKEQEKIDQQI